MARSLSMLIVFMGSNVLLGGCCGSLPAPVKVNATAAPDLARQLKQIEETGEIGDLGDEIAKLEPTNPAKAKELMADYVQLKRLSEDPAAVKAFAKKMAAKLP